MSAVSMSRKNAIEPASKSSSKTRTSFSPSEVVLASGLPIGVT